MAKEFMVGTVDDNPLQVVNHGGVKYFLDQETGEVFYDQPGLPKVVDEKIIEAVVKAAS